MRARATVGSSGACGRSRTVASPPRRHGGREGTGRRRAGRERGLGRRSAPPDVVSPRGVRAGRWTADRGPDPWP
ncbi:hypothetical protein FTX61_06715 [Nitriliruptoraceae bacterium ZYF776]|nr:hypothetical protein [Profundirhabdus halotolerans]